MIEAIETALAMPLLEIEGLTRIPNHGLSTWLPPGVQGYRPRKNRIEMEYLISGILDQGA